MVPIHIRCREKAFLDTGEQIAILKATDDSNPPPPPPPNKDDHPIRLPLGYLNNGRL